MRSFTRFLWTAATLALAQGQTGSDAFRQLRYRYIGPVGNRVIAAVGIPGENNTYYVGSASGGIFKSTDGGIHWEPIFDQEDVSSVGSLAITPSDPNIVWAGTGETFIRSHISVGNGIYKSLDAGKTWRRMGLEATGRIGRVIVDPHHPDVVFACAVGHAYGPQPERGVFRSADGGQTWQQVLNVDENTGCSDLAMDPNNSHIMFAGMWQLELKTWNRTSGGPGSGLYKSIDGGLTWRHITGHGLPAPPLGKIAVAMSKKNSSRVYALIETGDGVPYEGKPTSRGELWVSDDGGDNWRVTNYDRQLAGRAAYYTRCTVEPDNENEIYFMTAAFSRSLDGGKTLTDMQQLPGGDNHDLWIDPTNGDRLVVSNDSGVSISVNRGRTWNRVQLPVAQMYHVTVDNQIPYFVYGNKQDGSSYRGPSNSLSAGGFGGGGGGRGGASPISRSTWHQVTGGESGFATPDPVDPNIVWSSASGNGSIGGIVSVYDERNGQGRNVEVWPDQVNGSPAIEAKYRFNWEFPLLISPHDHKKVYVGSQYVHVTTDGGNSWRIISPDLTRNDKSKQGFSGGLTGDNIGVEYIDVVFALAESPKEAGLIWAGTNDGLVQITRDGGKNWTNVTSNIPGLPEWGTVSNIEASRYDAGTAYISVDFHQVNNRDPFIYRTNDYGKTWMRITDGIPHSMLSYVHCVREDTVRRGLLYAGTENGAYVSFNDGQNWQPLQMNLPHAPVYWIAVQDHFHDLVLATYGRGFWILDDLTPLEQMTPQVADSAAYLFPPREAYRFRTKVQPEAPTYDATAGTNPPYGASINYFLKAAPKSEVKFAILDASGRAVRTLTGGKLAGVNRLTWDLRFNPTKQMLLRTPPEYAPEVAEGPDGTRPAPNTQPISVLAPPGQYTVKMTVDGKDYTQKLTVIKDPHSNGSEGDIQVQTKILTSLTTEMNNMAEAVNQIELIRAQLAVLEAELGSDQNAAAIRTAAEQLNAKLMEIEDNIITLKATGRGQDTARWTPRLASKIAYLAGEVESSDDLPTTQQVTVNEELKERAATYRQRLQNLLGKEVADFNTLLRQKNVANVVTGVPEARP
ncbi:MAG TPA: hypothetical protein VMT15_09785 [Bryobacteraceae bacterium]|nr:hypothetical protein [Bryobacteraceae bacterium]